MALNKDKIEEAQFDIPEGYMTLKEASISTPYTPDYIGQLVRAGKLEGRQVYSNVIWVVREASLRDYVTSRGKDMAFRDGGQSAVLDSYIPHLARHALYGVIALAAVVALVLFYILSVSIDRKIGANYQDVESGTVLVTNDGIISE
jgi:hypothetical protein